MIANPRFDFAISFAGPDRTLAEDLKTQLIAYGYRVFYDRDFEHEMVGRDGAEYLHNVYSRETRFSVLLLSRDSQARPWPKYEKESIISRDLKGDQGSWIPVLVDGQRPEWLPETRVFFNLAERPVADLVPLLVRKFQAETDSFPGEPECQVHFPDPTLERLVREAIGRPTGPITRSALFRLTSMEARSKYVETTVSSIAGIQECEALERLALHSLWSATDLRPLARLGRLTTLEVGIDDERMLLYGSASHRNENGIRNLSPLSHLSRLQKLTMNHQSIADLAPLATIRGLEELGLARNQITNIEPLAALTRLTSLNLTYNLIDDISPIANLPNLRIAFLYANPIRDLRALAEKIQAGGGLGSRAKRDYEGVACELILDVERSPGNELARELLRTRGIKISSADHSRFYSSY
jgi:hypothetical protein